jgi:hypothetical protein
MYYAGCRPGNSGIVSLFDQSIGMGCYVFMNTGFPGLIENADIKIPGMQVDSTIMFVALGGKFHRGLLLRRWTNVSSRTVGLDTFRA